MDQFIVGLVCTACLRDSLGGYQYRLSPLVSFFC